jgi:flagellar basal body-associated protein FliL
LRLIKSNKGHACRQAGIGLIEVIAALAISIVVITALVSLSLFVLRSSKQSSSLQEATNEANEQMELLRAYRDASTWADFTSNAGIGDCGGDDYCYMSIPLAVDNLSAEEQVPTLDNRVVTYFTATDASGGSVSEEDNIVSIEVVSFWNIAGQNKTTSLYTNFSNWRGN